MIDLDTGSPFGTHGILKLIDAQTPRKTQAKYTLPLVYLDAILSIDLTFMTCLYRKYDTANPIKTSSASQALFNSIKPAIAHKLIMWINGINDIFSRSLSFYASLGNKYVYSPSHGTLADLRKCPKKIFLIHRGIISYKTENSPWSQAFPHFFDSCQHVN